LEVRLADAEHALAVLEQDYLRSTGLTSDDLSTADAVFDENAGSTVCPACGTAFVPQLTSTCPECGLRFG
jgi:predicted RNA-binding Zn-ribbon protein involved in translation (DUF1610 family)